MCVPVNLSRSLLLLLEVTKAISWLDTIQGGDVNGKPFRQGNIEGKMNSGHGIEKEKGRKKHAQKANS